MVYIYSCRQLYSIYTQVLYSARVYIDIYQPRVPPGRRSRTSCIICTGPHIITNYTCATRHVHITSLHRPCTLHHNDTRGIHSPGSGRGKAALTGPNDWPNWPSRRVAVCLSPNNAADTGHAWEHGDYIYIFTKNLLSYVWVYMILNRKKLPWCGNLCISKVKRANIFSSEQYRRVEMYFKTTGDSYLILIYVANAAVTHISRDLSSRPTLLTQKPGC